MAVRIDDLPSMALFAQVVQLRSFTAAARQAGLAKSAVSKRITQLEERLGVRLLNRTTRKLSLTEEGLTVYEHCAAILRAAAAAEEWASASTHLVRGTVRVNAPVTFSHMYLVHAIAGFLREHQEMDVHLVTEDRLVDVVEGGFDVVLRITRLEDSTLIARRLALDRLVVCGSPQYLARAGTPRSPDELANHNCLHYSLVAFANEWRFRSAQRQPNLPIAGNFRTSNGTALREAARAGLGLAVLPYFMVARDVAEGRLVLVLDRLRRAEIGIYAVFAERKHLPLRTRLFLEFLSAHFREANWLSLDGGPMQGG